MANLSACLANSNCRRSVVLVLLVVLFPLAAFADTKEDEHIRHIVETLLREKDEKMAKMEVRIQELEKQLAERPAVAKNSKATVPQNTLAPPSQKIAESDWTQQLTELSDTVATLREEVSQQGLDISGFFDFNLRTENQAEQTFNLGAVEVDLEYNYNPYFAASSALVWDGDHADIGVAVVDFHIFDNTIPPRGRIFGAQGFHAQVGRFDVPFSSDYQYFASRDRVTVSAPLTTERIQRGGFNGDGLRLYGAWNVINYAAFWTNSVYEDEGSSFGGRLGLTLGKESYSPHRRDNPAIIELGFSHLTDLDGSENARSTVYAGDLTFNYGIISLQSELAWLNSHEYVIDGNAINYGRAHEFAYHATLLAHLKSLIQHPVSVYARYDNWNPNSPVLLDSDDDTVVYGVETITRFTLGLNYAVNNYLQVKFEYADTLGSNSAEPDFENRLGTAQLVVAF